MEGLEFEEEGLKQSPIHRMDTRAKILSTLILIVGSVYLGRNGAVGFRTRAAALAVLEVYLLFLILLAGLDLRLVLKRLLLILPFGGTIAVLKPFIEPGTAIYVLFGITVTREGVLEGGTILMIMVVSITSIILLSSTSSMQRILNSAIMLGMPRRFALLLGMTMRYLFYYLHVFRKMAGAQATRAFSIRNRKAGYRTVLDQLGYAAAMIFVRAYEHGLKTHESMLSRCYSQDSALFAKGERMSISSVFFLIATLCAVSLPYLLLS